MTPRQEYAAAYRNVRMLSNNSAHSITDRFDYRWHGKNEFTAVSAEMREKAKKSHIDAFGGQVKHGFVDGGRYARFRSMVETFKKENNPQTWTSPTQWEKMKAYYGLIKGAVNE